MKDKEVNLEDNESSHTLGGTGEGRVQERGKWRGYTCYSTVEQDTVDIGHGEGGVVCSTLMESDKQKKKKNPWTLGFCLRIDLFEPVEGRGDRWEG